MSCKVYVTVRADFSADGQLLPRSFVWEDGRVYQIEKVKDIRRAASLKAGGVGLRYTCMIQGREKHLFYEGNCRWFMERSGTEL